MTDSTVDHFKRNSNNRQDENDESNLYEKEANNSKTSCFRVNREQTESLFQFSIQAQLLRIVF